MHILNSLVQSTLGKLCRSNDVSGIGIFSKLPNVIFEAILNSLLGITDIQRLSLACVSLRQLGYEVRLTDPMKCFDALSQQISEDIVTSFTNAEMRCGGLVTKVKYASSLSASKRLKQGTLVIMRMCNIKTSDDFVVFLLQTAACRRVSTMEAEARFRGLYDLNQYAHDEDGDDPDYYCENYEEDYDDFRHDRECEDLYSSE